MKEIELSHRSHREPTLQQESIARARISFHTEVKIYIYFATEVDKDQQTQYIWMWLESFTARMHKQWHCDFNPEI